MNWIASKDLFKKIRTYFINSMKNLDKYTET